MYNFNEISNLNLKILQNIKLDYTYMNIIIFIE